MATKNQEKVVKIIAKKVANSEKISIGEAIRESGVYGPSIAAHPGKLTEAKGYKELMELYLPDVVLDTVHSQLLVAKRLDFVQIPLDTGLSDEDLKDLIQNGYGCQLKDIRRGKHMIYVFFYAPDNRARKDALDMAFKRKGRYAPMRIYTEPDPLEDLPDSELRSELSKTEDALRQRLIQGNAGKKNKVARKE